MPRTRQGQGRRVQGQGRRARRELKDKAVDVASTVKDKAQGVAQKLDDKAEEMSQKEAIVGKAAGVAHTVLDKIDGDARQGRRRTVKDAADGCRRRRSLMPPTPPREAVRDAAGQHGHLDLTAVRRARRLATAV